MNVLVVGGTRGLGRAVVAAAHGAGHTLTAMARRAADFSGATTGIRLVLGDAADATDVDRAVAGQHAVVWAVGVPPTLRAVDVFSRGTQFLLAAMARHGVRRLVCVTGVGAGDDRGGRGFLHARLIMPLLRKSIQADKARQETQVRASGIDWTIVQPAALASGPATGLYRAITNAAPGPFKRVSRADVADFIVANLAAPDFVHATVVLSG